LISHDRLSVGLIGLFFLYAFVGFNLALVLVFSIDHSDGRVSMANQGIWEKIVQLSKISNFKRYPIFSITEKIYGNIFPRIFDYGCINLTSKKMIKILYSPLVLLPFSFI